MCACAGAAGERVDAEGHAGRAGTRGKTRVGGRVVCVRAQGVPAWGNGVRLQVIEDTAGSTGCACKKRGWQRLLVCAWCLGSAGDARGCPWGPRVLRGCVWEWGCVRAHPGTDEGGTWGRSGRKQTPPCRVGIGACRTCRPAPLRSLVGWKHAVSWAVRAACDHRHPPGASASLCSLPWASVLATGGTVTATDVCALSPRCSVPAMVETATLHQPWPRQQLPSLCFARLVLKGETIPPRHRVAVLVALQLAAFGSRLLTLLAVGCVAPSRC